RLLAGIGQMVEVEHDLRVFQNHIDVDLECGRRLLRGQGSARHQQPERTDEHPERYPASATHIHHALPSSMPVLERSQPPSCCTTRQDVWDTVEPVPSG